MLVITSLLVGVLARLAGGPADALGSRLQGWPLRSTGESRRAALLIALGIATAVGTLVWVGWLLSGWYIWDFISALPIVLLGSIVGYFGADVAIAARDEHPILTSAIAGVGALVLVAAQIFSAEDLRRRLRTVDTPWLKVELSVIERPDGAIGTTPVQFMNSASTATDAAEAAARGVARIVSQSQQMRLLAADLTQSDAANIQEYASESDKRLFEEILAPAAKCMAAVHSATPGDEKHRLISDNFRDNIYLYYQSSLSPKKDESGANNYYDYESIRHTPPTLEATDLIEEAGHIESMYEYYTASGRLEESATLSNCNHLRFDTALKLSYETRLPPSSSTHHLAFMVASMLAARGMNGEAANELAAWLNFIAFPRISDQDHQLTTDANDLYFYLSIIETTHWLARFTEHAGYPAATDAVRRVTVELIEELFAQSSPAGRIRTLAFSGTQQAFESDKKCEIVLEAQKHDLPEKVVEARLRLPALLVTNINNILYENWRSRNQHDRDRLISMTSQYVDLLQSYDFDCFPLVSGNDPVQAASVQLAFAETAITVGLNWLAELDTRDTDEIRVKLCELSLLYAPLASALDTLRGAMAPKPIAELAAAPVLDFRAILAGSEQERDRLETLNMVEDRLERLLSLLRAFAGDESLAFKSAYRKVCHP